MARSVFRFFTKMSVGFGRFLKQNRKKNKTETEHFSVGFSVGFQVKPAKKSTFQRIQRACAGVTCDDGIVWCQARTKSYMNEVGGTRPYEFLYKMFFAKSYIKHVGGTMPY